MADAGLGQYLGDAEAGAAFDTVDVGIEPRAVQIGDGLVEDLDDLEPIPLPFPAPVAA